MTVNGEDTTKTLEERLAAADPRATDAQKAQKLADEANRQQVAMRLARIPSNAMVPGNQTMGALINIETLFRILVNKGIMTPSEFYEENAKCAEALLPNSPIVRPY